MQKVGEFEKVSFEQFFRAMQEYLCIDINACTKDQFDTNKNTIKKIYDSLSLPVRATAGSAGYDFKAPFSFALMPEDAIKIPTGIRVRVDPGWWLGCLPRSGLGFKYQVHLANTLGVIDSDYYGSPNEGHIFLKIVNGGNKVVKVVAGDGVAQCIFIPYGVTYSDNAVEKRNGGFGSTDK